MSSIRIYLVGSLYTLINAVNLESSFRKKNISKSYLVYFGKVSEFHTSLFSNLENSLFEEIHIEKHPNNSNKFVNLFKLIFNKKIHINKKDTVEVFTQNLVFTLLGPFKKNKNYHFNYIEEGLSTYTDFNHKLENRNFWIKIINKLLKGKFIPDFKNVYVYEKLLYKGTISTKILPKFDVSLFKVPEVNQINKENFPKKMFLGSPISTLDSLLIKNLNINEKNDFQFYVKNKLDEVSSILIKNEFYYKAHPNESINEIHNNFKIHNTNLPWELDINSLNENNILVSVFSTASITPKTLYNKEPWLIFLFRLLSPYSFFQAEEFLSRVRNSYYNKDRILVPKTITELSEILNELSNNVN